MKLESLRESSELLKRISNTELEFFESVATELDIAAGEILFEEGGAADAFYIIVAGKIGLELTSPGRVPIVIQTLGAGDLVLLLLAGGQLGGRGFRDRGLLFRQHLAAHQGEEVLALSHAPLWIASSSARALATRRDPVGFG